MEDIVSLFTSDLRYEPHQKWFKDVMWQGDFQCDEGLIDRQGEEKYEEIGNGRIDYSTVYVPAGLWWK